MSKVKIEKNLKYKRGDIKVVNPEQRPLKEDYDIYVTIKNHLKYNNYDPKKLYKISKFNVADIGFNSIFLKALKDLLLLLKNLTKYPQFKSYIMKSEKQLLKLCNKKK